jgi:hypothetical protein
MKKTRVISSATRHITYLVIALGMSLPATAQSQVKDTTCSSANPLPPNCNPGAQDISPINSSPQGQSVIQMARDVVKVGGAYQFAKVTRNATVQATEEHLGILLVPKAMAKEKAPRVHKILTSEPMQYLSSGVLIGTAAFTTYDLFMKEGEVVKRKDQYKDEPHPQNAQKKP